MKNLHEFIEERDTLLLYYMRKYLYNHNPHQEGISKYECKAGKKIKKESSKGGSWLNDLL
jgi:hypothetical protein